MRISHLLAAAASAFVVGLGGAAHAVQTPTHLQGRPALELADGTSARAQREVRWHRAPRSMDRAWKRFLGQTGAGWHAGWDTVTGVPARLWGRGIPAPGSVASPAAAEKAARAIFAKHIDLLAPGSSIGDFVLTSNDLDVSAGGGSPGKPGSAPTPPGMRTLGFVQTRSGARVIGGQVSFRFKNDRLILIGSEALPFVNADAPAFGIPADAARKAAAAWMLTESVTADAKEVSAPMLLPILGPSQVRGYRAVVEVTVHTTGPIGRWAVYLDAASGAPVGRRQTLMFASATGLYHTPDRWPGGGRADHPAPGANFSVDGVAAPTDANGLFSWAGATPAEVTAVVTGPLVSVLNDQGPEATSTFPIDDGGSFVWDASNDEFTDAQLTTYVATHEVKAYCKNIAPQMSWLSAKVTATDNIDDVCNAFSDGTDINFFNAGQAGGVSCENTGRLPDVVFHEFGHSFHNHAIIPGVGVFEGALSEGQSDYLAATITGDPAMGIGFFLNGQPLRHIDPPNKEFVWPDDIDPDTHETGKIIAGALWDLRKLLIAKLGPEAGVAATDQLYYQAIRRASDIPTMYPEILAADDDDGDLENGTPNVCEINQAFAAHGLRAIGATTPGLGAVPPSQDGYKIAIQLEGLFPQCPNDAVVGANLSWKVRGAADPAAVIAMTPNGNAYEATIPPQPGDTVVSYRVDLTTQGNSVLSFPDNLADPMYELYVGPVDVLYCTDFETNPADQGWTHGLTSGSGGEGADDWQWDTPAGAPGSGDPGEAYSGKRVFGNDLGHGNFNGNYQANKVNFALSPVVQTGKYKKVRLQYRRWLNVEDANFDEATIYANDTPVWQNFDSMMGDDSATQHQDKEWRFQDVDLSPHVKDGAVQVKFEIASDGGLELGGWTLDDFCIVGVPEPVCGDGVVGGAETCDDGPGNSDTAPDACRSDCTPARCGDGVVDTGEACDDGNDDDGDGCHNDCTAPEAPAPGPKADPDGTELGGCGCRAAGDENAPWPLGLVALGLPLAWARRRRR